MEWVSVVALLGLMILLINLSAKSSFAKNEEKKALKSARDWAKKNPKKVRRAKNIDKKVDSTFFLIFKILLIGVISIVFFFTLHPAIQFFAAAPIFLTLFVVGIILINLSTKK